MRARSCRTLRVAIATLAIAAAGAPAAHSQIYKWTDVEGSPTYSNHPPSSDAPAIGVTVLTDLPGTVPVPDKRAVETAPTDKPRPATASSAAAQHAAPRPATANVLEDFNHAATAAEAPAVTSAPQARINASPNAPEAVRDPCLVSGDPRCYERNRAAYVPFRGYSPATAAVAVPVGATTASAGGTLAGGSPAAGPGKIVAPKSSLYAVPPGSDMRPLTPVRTPAR